MRSTLLRQAFVATAVSAVALVGVGASGASAGEVTGNGKLKEVHGTSICAYSGQNDGFHHAEHQKFLGDDARVQSFGQLVRAFGPMGGVPGQACNPTVPPPSEEP